MSETRIKDIRRDASAACLPAKSIKVTAHALDWEGTVDQWIERFLTDSFRQLTSGPFVANGKCDQEDIHQLRVILRRIRTAIWIIRREFSAPSLLALTDDARSLARILAPARNWDVFFTEMLPRIEATTFRNPELPALRAVANACREEGYTAAEDLLAGQRFSQFLEALDHEIGLGGWRIGVPDEALAHPIGPFAYQALRHLRRRVRKQGRQLSGLSPEALHKLRLSLKKLRYAMEFFPPLWKDRGRMKRYLTQVSAMQTELGTYNDMTTALSLLRIAQAEAVPSSFQKIIETADEWAKRGKRDALRLFTKRWDKFQKMQPAQ